MVVTEQYPQGLGPTVPELGAQALRKIPKTCFSMLVPEVERELGARPDLRSVLLCGIETQACIMVLVYGAQLAGGKGSGTQGSRAAMRRGES